MSVCIKGIVWLRKKEREVVNRYERERELVDIRERERERERDLTSESVR